MRTAYSIFLCLFSLLTNAQTKIDTIPFSDIYFDRFERINLNEFEVLDTLENPDGFIVDGKNSKKVLIQNGNEFKSFNIPYKEINGGSKIEITRKEIIEGGYEELIVIFTYRNGKSFDSNGYSETTKGIEIFDLTNNKLIFSVDYYEGSEEWDDSNSTQNCDYCKEVSIKKNEIELTPSSNATDEELEKEIYLIQENKLIKKTIANNGYK